MSIKEIEQEAENRLELNALPDTIKKAIVKKTLWKNDSKDKRCLYVEFEVSEITGEPQIFTQKYSPMHLEELKKAMLALNIESLDGQTLKLKLTKFHIGNARMIPV